MVKSFDLSVTAVTLAALSAILEYRYLSVHQVATIVGLRPKSASELLLRLERHRALSHFGNTGIRGYGKTPKVYFLTKRGHRLLAAEYEALGQTIAPFKPVNMTSRWSPLMYHRMDTLNVLASLERDFQAMQDYARVATLVEYRREKIGRRWRTETTDYVSDPTTAPNKIVPDAGFVIEHRGSGKRALFLIEVDCGTTQLLSFQPDADVNSFTNKLAQYDRYLASGRVTQRYQHLGSFSGFHVLVVTSSEARVANMRKAAATLPASFHPYYRFSTIKTVRQKFLHDGWLSRDHADHTTYPLIKGT
ncbi:protein involved in plasmid replication-relaxation [Litoreibacter meonggei]|uniref:Protein involved in plasmid replication-relaxation n=1 Tax=Litoreibacter meonggei TaxID=1049199 RepID=A0A497X6H9_9RHOB|nr:replication-relaxation family protein [Litoreibacter meonggei]RLJ60752.1 protein involved in plasmid replication-relaxation [Litoreibacter meonggei]